MPSTSVGRRTPTAAGTRLVVAGAEGQRGGDAAFGRIAHCMREVVGHRATGHRRALAGQLVFAGEKPSV